ncbi:hypothetical protein [Peristeroidobacter agariperforans]|uniref:hypothetical protein n=1 Tax=Peristeroidobacter agariperforans TaxID=268404 RepID=UPI00101C237B|nr:hypothetical protein [Peristeroidobacter agariperforans]
MHEGLAVPKHSILAVITVAACWLASHASADECRTTLPRYSKFLFPQLLSALDKSCLTTLDRKEQLFVAGMAEYFLSNCDVPTLHRLELQKFLTSSALVGAMGSEYKTSSLGDGLADQQLSGTAYATGGSVARDIGCQGSAPLTKGLLAYLHRTGSADGEGARYVRGCAEYYRGRYTEQNCQCLADLGRSVHPKIHSAEFSPESIKNIIESNPLVGLTIAFQCGIGDY